MRIDHQQHRASEAGRVLAADFRCRHQAHGQALIGHQVLPGPEGQGGRGDRGDHQRAGNQAPRPEVQHRHEHRFRARPRRVLCAGRRRQCRRLRHRRHFVVRAYCAPPRAAGADRGGRPAVVRPLRHHVPQGRSAAQRGGAAHVPGAGGEPRHPRDLSPLVHTPDPDRGAAQSAHEPAARRELPRAGAWGIGRKVLCIDNVSTITQLFRLRILFTSDWRLACPHRLAARMT